MNQCTNRFLKFLANLSIITSYIWSFGHIINYGPVCLPLKWVIKRRTYASALQLAAPVPSPPATLLVWFPLRRRPPLLLRLPLLQLQTWEKRRIR
ncbi:hypothetical protein L1887_19038 [Cichorium endivia]|nr:hypothetical protein L1887_19038 [Cichorium endivia]